MWQPYEADFEDLLPWCVAGRAVWMATVPLVCFHLVEIHTPDRVVRQFGMIQEIPGDVDTDTVLYAIDLRGKVGVEDWFKRVTRRFIDVPGATLILMVTSPCLLHLTVLLSMKPLFIKHDICGPVYA